MATPQSNFNHILRLLNTNVDGKQKVVYSLTKIKGVGRRYCTSASAWHHR